MSLRISLGLDLPLAINFRTITPLQDEVARRGICPHCHTKTLAKRHEADELQFLQCSKCLVVVALEAK